MKIDWQDLANELSDGIREINTAIDSYNKALDRADDARKQIAGEEGSEIKEGYNNVWCEAEGSIMAMEEQIRELAALTDFIDEHLAEQEAAHE